MEQDAPRQLLMMSNVEQALIAPFWSTIIRLKRVSAMLKPEHFYDPLHQRIYDAIERMWPRSCGHAADLEGGAGARPRARRSRRPGLSRESGARCAALPNVKDYARILADFAMRRELIRMGEDIVNTAYEAPIDISPAAQVEEAEKALYRIAEKGASEKAPSVSTSR